MHLKRARADPFARSFIIIIHSPRARAVVQEWSRNNNNHSRAPLNLSFFLFLVVIVRALSARVCCCCCTMSSGLVFVRAPPLHLCGGAAGGSLTASFCACQARMTLSLARSSIHAIEGGQ